MSSDLPEPEWFTNFKHRKNYFRYRENNFFDVVGSSWLYQRKLMNLRIS